MEKPNNQYYTTISCNVPVITLPLDKYLFIQKENEDLRKEKLRLLNNQKQLRNLIKKY